MVKKARPRFICVSFSMKFCRYGVASSMNVLMRMPSLVQRITSVSVASIVSGTGG